MEDFVFYCFLTTRIFSALFLHITDCDETYNYWEPVHYLLFGKGFQTWEYSPEFGLRSYLYLLLHAVPAWCIKGIFGINSTSLFYCIRIILAAVCAGAETSMYRSIRTYYGNCIAKRWLFFQLVCPGMFISSTAFLPSTFSMYFTMIFFSAWLRKSIKLAILSIAISSLLGWPFSALLSLPFLYSAVIKNHSFKRLFKYSFLSAIGVGSPLIAVDSYYYGKWTIAPVNIILYNVFTSHGPNIFGTEPASFYILNLFLNFNVLWCFAICYPIVIFTKTLQRKKQCENEKETSINNFWKVSSTYIWMLVFFVQSHKEERFLFPIYPLLTLCAALCIVETKRIWNNITNNKIVQIGNMTLFLLLSMSRISALYMHYHAPMEILRDLQPTESDKNICIAKEWHRVPGNFFMPQNNHLQFVGSHFDGILPAYFAETIGGTSLIHAYFNNLNKANDNLLFDMHACDFFIDSDFGEPYHINDIEPNYSKDNYTWEIVTSIPFLDSKRSSRFFRSFYFPVISSKFTKYGNLNLLKRKDDIRN